MNSTCYIASVVAAIVVAAWGLNDVFRGKQPDEENDVQVVSRQLRGFAILSLSSVIVIIAVSVCLLLSKGSNAFLKNMSKISM
jgi:hypothetical protein